MPSLEDIRADEELAELFLSICFDIAQVGKEYCVWTGDFNMTDDGVFYIEHPSDQYPGHLSVRTVPEKFEPISQHKSVKLKVIRDVYEGHVAADVTAVDCKKQNIESNQIKNRRDAANPDRERRSRIRGDVDSHI